MPSDFVLKELKDEEIGVKCYITIYTALVLGRRYLLVVFVDFNKAPVAIALDVMCSGVPVHRITV